ncbi:hypothetical protein BCV70DRAFT_91326 [Testicularia cyperi]|uniref:Uncharacterized protein n=1 Tax=Testicularia cyperi TaxID=1882483 RepID=A0A317XV76_9BASI|nr:hypothetical protein BCV70DRAFT_91326 [Testicularia cyperi]
MLAATYHQRRLLLTPCIHPFSCMKPRYLLFRRRDRPPPPLLPSPPNPASSTIHFCPLRHGTVQLFALSILGLVCTSVRAPEEQRKDQTAHYRIAGYSMQVTTVEPDPSPPPSETKGLPSVQPQPLAYHQQPRLGILLYRVTTLASSCLHWPLQA